MNPQTALEWTLVVVAAAILSGCATRTVVVPKPVHAHNHHAKHVDYHVKPAKKHCVRHQGHWDCR